MFLLQLLLLCCCLILGARCVACCSNGDPPQHIGLIVCTPSQALVNVYDLERTAVTRGSTSWLQPERENRSPGSFQATSAAMVVQAEHMLGFDYRHHSALSSRLQLVMPGGQYLGTVLPLVPILANWHDTRHSIAHVGYENRCTRKANSRRTHAQLHDPIPAPSIAQAGLCSLNNTLL